MFTELLSAFTKGGFDESLVINFKEPTRCVSLNNQPCQARPSLVDINSKKTLFCLFYCQC